MWLPKMAGYPLHKSIPIALSAAPFTVAHHQRHLPHIAAHHHRSPCATEDSRLCTNSDNCCARLRSYLPRRKDPFTKSPSVMCRSRLFGCLMKVTSSLMTVTLSLMKVTPSLMKVSQSGT